YSRRAKRQDIDIYVGREHQMCIGDTPVGPHLTGADEPPSGNLGLAADQILTDLAVTHTGILNCMRSSAPYGTPTIYIQRSPTPDASIKPWLDACIRGRGALYVDCRCTVRSAGPHTIENAGMSNGKIRENLIRRKPKVS
ncbi:hypothetical protein AMQ84_00140, partial [Paenibacillus riograndensis]